MSIASRTLVSSVNKALHFYSKRDSMYLGIGGFDPWTDEEYPPEPSYDNPTISDIAVYRKVGFSDLVVPDPNGSIVYKDGTQWEVVTEGNAKTEGAKWVYLGAVFVDTDLPLLSYRKIGLYVDLVTTSTEDIALPEQVTSQGDLELIMHTKKVDRYSYQKDVSTFIVQF